MQTKNERREKGCKYEKGRGERVFRGLFTLFRVRVPVELNLV